MPEGRGPVSLRESRRFPEISGPAAGARGSCRAAAQGQSSLSGDPCLTGCMAIAAYDDGDDMSGSGIGYGNREDAH